MSAWPTARHHTPELGVLDRLWAPWYDVTACVGDEKRLPDLADRRRCRRRACLVSAARRRLAPAPEVRGSTSPEHEGTVRAVPPDQRRSTEARGQKREGGDGVSQYRDASTTPDPASGRERRGERQRVYGGRTRSRRGRRGWRRRGRQRRVGRRRELYSRFTTPPPRGRRRAGRRAGRRQWRCP